MFMLNKISESESESDLNLEKNSIQEYCYIIHWTKYIIKHYLMKCTMIFMCKYSNEMMTSIRFRFRLFIQHKHV